MVCQKCGYWILIFNILECVYAYVRDLVYILLVFAGVLPAEIIRYVRVSISCIFFGLSYNYDYALQKVVKQFEQPQYEKVAKLFNGADAVHPGIILMTRVDCALKVFTLCFPTY